MEKNITVFGDSISKGCVLNENKIITLKNGAVSLIEQRYNIKINNMSTYGQTLTRLSEKGYIDDYIKNLDKTKQNFVVFSIGGNDSDYDWKLVTSAPNVFHEPKTPIKVFYALLDSQVKKLQNNGVKVILTTLPPVNSKRYFEAVISKIVDGDKVLEFFGGDISNITRRQECYSYEILKCALKNNCGIIDIRSLFLLERNYLDYFSIDGVHPNEGGHKKIADKIVEEIDRGLFD